MIAAITEYLLISGAANRIVSILKAILKGKYVLVFLFLWLKKQKFESLNDLFKFTKLSTESFFLALKYFYLEITVGYSLDDPSFVSSI